MPRIVGEAFGEFHLRRRVKLLPRQTQSGCGNTRRKLFWPEHGIILDRHEMRIGLQLQTHIELDIAFGKRSDHRLAQIVVRRSKREPRNASLFA